MYKTGSPGEFAVELYDRAETEKHLSTGNRWMLFAAVVGAVALIACVVCCVLTNTANAARMESATILISTLGCWLVAFSLTARAYPLKQLAVHERNVLEAERETLTGTFSLEPEVLQIPKSVSIRKVVVCDGIDTRRLSIRSDKAELLRRLEGRKVTFRLAYGYIVAFEVANENS